MMKRTEKILLVVLCFTLLFSVTIRPVMAVSDYLSEWLRTNTLATSDNKSLRVEFANTVGDPFTASGDLVVTDDATINGFMIIPPTTIAAQSYTVSSTGKASVYLSEYSDTGASSIYFPDAPADGTMLFFKDNDLNAGTNNVTLYPNAGGSDTIEETTSAVFDANGDAAWFLYDADNTNWSIMGDF